MKVIMYGLFIILLLVVFLGAIAHDDGKLALGGVGMLLLLHIFKDL